MNKKEREYFNKFKNKFEYFVDIMPIKVSYAFYNHDDNCGVIVECIGKKKGFDVNFNIPVPEYIEKIIKPYFQDMLPSFVKTIEKEVSVTPERIKEILRKNTDLKIKDLVEMKEKIEYVLSYTIEGIHSRDRRLIVSDGLGFYFYKYSSLIDNIKEFISSKTKEELSRFVLNSCRYQGEYNKKFKINIRYTGEQMFNFFRLNRDKIKSEIFYNPDKDFWEWGRYNIYFENDKMEYKCLNIYTKRRMCL